MSDTESFLRNRPEKNPPLWKELWGLLRENKKYWLIPLLVVLLLTGLILVFSGSSLAPFIYPLF